MLNIARLRIRFSFLGQNMRALQYFHAAAQHPRPARTTPWQPRNVESTEVIFHQEEAGKEILVDIEIWKILD